MGKIMRRQLTLDDCDERRRDRVHRERAQLEIKLVARSQLQTFVTARVTRKAFPDTHCREKCLFPDVPLVSLFTSDSLEMR